MRGLAGAVGPGRPALEEQARLEVEVVDSGALVFGCLALAAPVVLFPEAESWSSIGVSVSRKPRACRNVRAGPLPVGREGGPGSTRALWPAM